MSQLWNGFREIGIVTDGTPLAFERRGTETLLATSIGRGHQIYSVSKLRLLFVGSGQRRRSTAMVFHGGRLYVAEGSAVSVWKRGKEMALWQPHTDKIAHLFLLGDLLITVSRSSLLLAQSLGRDDYGATALRLQLPFGSDEVTAVCHPATYLNKLLVGTADGRLQLWNIKTQSLVHAFGKASFTSAVTMIEPSPALDVVAVALASGDVHLVNVRTDALLFSFAVEQSPPVSMSFRTDGPPLLAVGCEDGSVAVFHLAERRLLSLLPSAHRARITTLHFLPGEPIMVTAAPDNSTKVWIFDRQDGLGCRVLRQRSGHSQPPTFVRHYGGLQSELLLSAGRDAALRLFNVIQDQQNVEFSQGVNAASLAKLKKHAAETALWALDGHATTSVLEPVHRFAFSKTRERDWDNIVSCHVGDAHAYTWRFDNQAIGSHRVHATEPGPPSRVTAVAASVCGNFFVIGTQQGWIDRFNFQSGLHRGAYTTSDDSEKTGKQPAHDKAVTGLVCDPLNRYLISASLDGDVKLWDFTSRRLLYRHAVGSSVTLLEGFATTGGLLLALASDDLAIRIFDVESRRFVRCFRGHTSQITDVSFSPDGRWLVSASTDATLRVWDLPSATMIDWAKLAKPVTSLSFSPAGDFLVTAHVDSLGLSLWSNANHFSSVFFRPPSAKPALLAMHPSSAAAAASSEQTASAQEEKESADAEKEKKKARTAVAPLAKSLVTLSGMVSETHWKSLSELDAIKARNKPKAPPRAPEAAPFFLPSRPGLEFQWDLPAAANDDDEDISAQQAQLNLRAAAADHAPPLAKLLRRVTSSERPWNSVAIVEYLAGKGPSHVDLEFRSLDTGDADLFAMLIDVFVDLLERESGSFELCQAYLNLFLTIYSEELLARPQLHDRVRHLQQVQQLSWLRLEGMFQSTLCLVEYFSGVV